jgi:hypothetical protein
VSDLFEMIFQLIRRSPWPPMLLRQPEHAVREWVNRHA